ncbi:MAG: glutamine synthetase family protein [Lachnospiraceae bacterium]|nr:glutamine synthetase family protein [Lachnospiraceae bacterium]
MKYSKQEVIQYVQEEDVKFIRLAFCDVFGKQKNISIMPEELPRAFEYGIAIDASAIDGFGDEAGSDLFLLPDPSTLAVLPWRPEHGRVIRLFCNIVYPNRSIFQCDTRSLLQKAIQDAKNAGVEFSFGAEMEFYLFQLDENSNPTQIPYDNAGYMDIAPDDKGENVRREICLTLEQMGIRPESSHHEDGPGQNEIDFRYSDPLSAADNAMTFQTVVKTVANRNGLYADFSPKPLSDKPGNGLHINISARKSDGEPILPFLIAGILDKISDITVFLNPCEKSYERFGKNKAPKYISWSEENRSQLIRVPAAIGEFRRAELRSPDPSANPYLAFSLLIYAGLYGIKKRLLPPDAVNINLFTVKPNVLANFKALPESLETAVYLMSESSFIKEILPRQIINIYSRNNINE